MPASDYEDLSIDDLLRLQDGRERKRPRLSTEEDNFKLGDNTASGSSEDGEDSSDAHSNGNEVADENVATAGSRIRVRPKDEESSLSRVKVKAASPPNSLATGIPKASLSWTTLGITPPLQAALTSMSIRKPTEIQAACIPPLIGGRDCIGIAKTGSGKTIAFALPILQRLSIDPYGIFALVLTPTRELAFQIADQFAVLGGAINVRTAVVVGGMDMMSQALELKNRPHIVVATPGRIVDHLQSGSGEWDLSRVKFLVLDEADRLLTATFAPELQHLFEILPRERQTCLFTATWTPAVEQLATAPPKPGKEKLFVHRMTATVETVETLKQHYILVPSHVRESYLFYLLCHPPEGILHMRRGPPEPKRKQGKSKKKQSKKAADADEDAPEQPPATIIFCNRPRTAAYLTSLLKTLGIRSTALHSRLTQRERLSSLSLFRASVVPVLISTDVGARGLDIEDVAMIINWDMPGEPEEYTHRVGRTARAGKGGVAVSFVTEKDEERVLKVEERINTRLQEIELPEGKVLEKLNAVSTAKRLANMELHDSDFGKREEVHRAKKAKRG